MNFRIAHIFTAAALVAASVFAPTMAATAADAADTGDVTWTVRTASNELGDDRTSYSYVVDPGGEIADALVIANRGEEDLTLAVYASDGYTTEGGQFDVDTRDQKATGIGAWAAAEADTVTVKAGETATVPFTITVPADATPGDYAGGIVTSLAQDASSPGVSVDRRLGIRMAARVSGDLAPAMTVDGLQVNWGGGLNPFAGGDATVTYTINNTGNTIISGAQSATIAGPFGWFPTDTGEVEAPPQLLPGESWQQSVVVPDVAALVLLTATATVLPTATDASGSTSALSPVAASASGWAVPWTLLAIIILVVLGIIFVPRWLRTRAWKRQAAEDARVQDAVDRALQDAADEQPAALTH